MQRGAATDFSNIEFVFLDRDGVINRKPAAGQFVTRWEEFELLPGVEDAIAQMNRTGRKAIVVTNLFEQNDVLEAVSRLGLRMMPKTYMLNVKFPIDIGGDK